MTWEKLLQAAFHEADSRGRIILHSVSIYLVASRSGFGAGPGLPSRSRRYHRATAHLPERVSTVEYAIAQGWIA